MVDWKLIYENWDKIPVELKERLRRAFEARRERLEELFEREPYARKVYELLFPPERVTPPPAPPAYAPPPPGVLVPRPREAIIERFWSMVREEAKRLGVPEEEARRRAEEFIQPELEILAKEEQRAYERHLEELAKAFKAELLREAGPPPPPVLGLEAPRTVMSRLRSELEAALNRARYRGLITEEYVEATFRQFDEYASDLVSRAEAGAITPDEAVSKIREAYEVKMRELRETVERVAPVVTAVEAVRLAPRMAMLAEVQRLAWGLTAAAMGPFAPAIAAPAAPAPPPREVLYERPLEEGRRLRVYRIGGRLFKVVEDQYGHTLSGEPITEEELERLRGGG